MDDQRIGTCSLCGGEVHGFRGAWHSVVPPPPDRCTRCGAVTKLDVIEMARPGEPIPMVWGASNASGWTPPWPPQ